MMHRYTYRYKKLVLIKEKKEQLTSFSWEVNSIFSIKTL